MGEVEECRATIPPAARFGLLLEAILPFAGNGFADVGKEATFGWISANVVRILPPRNPPKRRGKRLPDWASLELCPSIESCGLK